MAITITSLTHPTMLAKIRLAMRHAFNGHGEKMNGHSHRCYIKNSKGHAIIRLDWRKAENAFVIYGSESRVITNMVTDAFHLDRKRRLV